jgi:hypothetical protein
MKISLTKQMKNLVKLLVSYTFLISFSVHAGSYEDFFRAVRSNDAQSVEKLLQLGFDPNTPDSLGQLPVVIALREPALKVASVLINSAQLKLNLLNTAGESALMIAALTGNLELARIMVAKDADINKTGWTALHYAASKGHTDVISFLLENHAYIDAASPNGTTPLMMASRYGSTESVKLLLDQGADASLKNMQGLTALQFAQTGVRPDAISLLGALKKQRNFVKPAGSW